MLKFSHRLSVKMNSLAGISFGIKGHSRPSLSLSSSRQLEFSVQQKKVKSILSKLGEIEEKRKKIHFLLSEIK